MPSSKVIRVNNYIQAYLQDNGLASITPVEIARELNKDGILLDSQSRRGLPLRNLIREGRIEGAWQDESRRWHIDRMENHTEKYSIKHVADLCGYKSVQPIYSKISDSTIPCELDENGNYYFLKDKIEAWIQENTKLPVAKPSLSHLDVMTYVKNIEKLAVVQSTDVKSIISLLESTKISITDEKLIGKLDLIMSLIEADMGTWQAGLKEVIKAMKDDSKEGT